MQRAMNKKTTFEKLKDALAMLGYALKIAVMIAFLSLLGTAALVVLGLLVKWLGEL
jgi:hypothetical protein